MDAAVVESRRRPEGVESMALKTFSGKLPLVIITVAIEAPGGQRFVEHRFALAGRKCHADLAVALRAGQRGVFSLQGETGIGLMVEFRLHAVETEGRMAAVARRAKLPEMDIGMAISACRRQGSGQSRRISLPFFVWHFWQDREACFPVKGKRVWLWSNDAFLKPSTTWQSWQCFPNFPWCGS